MMRMTIVAFSTVALVSSLSVGSAVAASNQLTAKAPDLVPVAERMKHGTVSVRNVGSANAGSFVVTVQCQKQGGGGCAEPSPRAVAPYENPAYPNRLVVVVPGLAQGKVFNHKIAFWDTLVWPAGTFNFLVHVDPGATVAETNEGNNIYGTSYSP
jgi:hypothetical protein